MVWESVVEAECLHGHLKGHRLRRVVGEERGAARMDRTIGGQDTRGSDSSKWRYQNTVVGAEERQV